MVVFFFSLCGNIVCMRTCYVIMKQQTRHATFWLVLVLVILQCLSLSPLFPYFSVSPVLPAVLSDNGIKDLIEQPNKKTRLTRKVCAIYCRSINIVQKDIQNIPKFKYIWISFWCLFDIIENYSISMLRRTHQKQIPRLTFIFNGKQTIVRAGMSANERDAWEPRYSI